MTTVQNFSKQLNSEKPLKLQVLQELKKTSLKQLKAHAEFHAWQPWAQ